MGIIYQLVSSHSQKVYVGKSTETPSQRMSKHRCDYRRWLEGKHHYNSSYELLKYTDCSMVVLEHGVPDHLLAEREAYWHSRYDCVNRCVPNRSHKEWYQANKDKVRRQQNQKYNCQCGGRYTQQNKTTHNRSKKHREWKARDTYCSSSETSRAGSPSCEDL